MIPHEPIDCSSALPEQYAFWLPKREDLSEEGFGYFRGTWLIRGVSLKDANSILDIESAFVSFADDYSDSADEFDRILGVLEGGDAEEWRMELDASANFDLLEQYSADGSPLDGLEAGVAGLVYALSYVGCWPAASCRGHAGPRAWSSRPVVLLATDMHRAKALEPLVAKAGCGFDIDTARPQLLGIEARSVRDTMELGRLVLEARKAFRRKGRKQQHATNLDTGARSTQLRLNLT